jgi:prolyl-tRNA synthetase
VIPGVKSATERFAGAEETFTIEAMMQNGWALQAGTSHFLGQNFAKAFDVTFQNSDGQLEHVWATSWGVSTRLVGAVIMAHSDDVGLVLPPKIAPIQVVLVPLWRKDEDKSRVMEFTEKVQAAIGGNFRVHVDAREKMKPGAKYFEWERKGVPLRFEIGPRDVDNNSVFCAKRTGGKKFGITLDDGFQASVRELLVGIQEELLQTAIERRDANTHQIDNYDEMKDRLQESGGFYLAPWHDDAEAERKIKEDCKATIRCFPLDAQGQVHGKSCFYSGRPATHMAIFARAY